MKKLIALLLLICCMACSSSSSPGTHTISGTITSQGTGLSGVMVSLTRTVNATATTDASGNYRFVSLPNGPYSVYPSKLGFVFTPAALPINLSNNNSTGNNFTASIAPPFAAVQLPKTGQTVAYYPGDDGTLQKGVAWPNPRFTDNGDGTVTDNLTGLIWLKNAGCFGTLKWFDALSTANSLASGSCGLTDNSNVGDWRLPNINELSSLISTGNWDPALPDNPFVNVQTTYYWSSSTSAELISYAWLVYTSMGYVNTTDKTSLIDVWPVKNGNIQTAAVSLPRTGQTASYAIGDDGYFQKGAIWPATRFTDNVNGTVTDNLTGLVWLKNANCLDDTVSSISKIQNYGQLLATDSLTWTNALASGICGLTDGSQAGDWRVPNRNELNSLIDHSQANPALPVGHPFDNVQLDGYWSSSILVNGNGAGASTMTWFEYLGNGVISIDRSEGPGTFYVWPVREAK